MGVGGKSGEVHCYINNVGEDGHDDDAHDEAGEDELGADQTD